VLSGGTWALTATVLAEGAHAVVASVSDAAGNVGVGLQTLTITLPADPVVPVDPVAPRYRPDAEIRRPNGSFVGAFVYGTDQRATHLLRGSHRKATFEVRVTNRGDATDELAVRGTPKNRKFKVIYMTGGQNVSRAIFDGSYRTRLLQPGESTTLTVKVTRLSVAAPGSKRTLQIQVGSSRAHVVDTVVAVTKVAGGARLGPVNP
jgi:hypothetical protein